MLKLSNRSKSFLFSTTILFSLGTGPLWAGFGDPFEESVIGCYRQQTKQDTGPFEKVVCILPNGRVSLTKGFVPGDGDCALHSLQVLFPQKTINRKTFYDGLVQAFRDEGPGLKAAIRKELQQEIAQELLEPIQLGAERAEGSSPALTAKAIELEAGAMDLIKTLVAPQWRAHGLSREEQALCDLVRYPNRQVPHGLDYNNLQQIYSNFYTKYRLPQDQEKCPRPGNEFWTSAARRAGQKDLQLSTVSMLAAAMRVQLERAQEGQETLGSYLKRAEDTLMRDDVFMLQILPKLASNDLFLTTTSDADVQAGAGGFAAGAGRGTLGLACQLFQLNVQLFSQQGQADGGVYRQRNDFKFGGVEQPKMMVLPGGLGDALRGHYSPLAALDDSETQTEMSYKLAAMMKLGQGAFKGAGPRKDIDAILPGLDPQRLEKHMHWPVLQNPHTMEWADYCYQIDARLLDDHQYALALENPPLPPTKPVPLSALNARVPQVYAEGDMEATLRESRKLNPGHWEDTEIDQASLLESIKLENERRNRSVAPLPRPLDRIQPPSEPEKPWEAVTPKSGFWEAMVIKKGQEFQQYEDAQRRKNTPQKTVLGQLPPGAIPAQSSSGAPLSSTSYSHMQSSRAASSEGTVTAQAGLYAEHGAMGSSQQLPSSSQSYAGRDILAQQAYLLQQFESAKHTPSTPAHQAQYCPQIDPQLHWKFDPQTGQPLKLGLDPITGKKVEWKPKYSGRDGTMLPLWYDPLTGEQSEWKFDPQKGQALKLGLDPITGKKVQWTHKYSGKTGAELPWWYDPQTGEQLNWDYDPQTGMLLADDPRTGRKVQWKPKYSGMKGTMLPWWYDPQTGEQLDWDYDPQTGMLLADDPRTGRKVQWKPKYSRKDGTMLPWLYDPQTNQPL